MQVDLVVGGGRYGTKAARYLFTRGISCIIVDPDPGCLATTVVKEGDRSLFLCGGLKEAYRVFLEYRPVRVFPTAPVHVAAGMASAAFGLEESAGINEILLTVIPPELVVGTKGGSVYLSRNREAQCLPDCHEPVTCPVTGEPRSIRLSSELRKLLPKAHIIESLQVAPGLGALRGRDLRALLAETGGRNIVIIGTACRCHGVITVLEKDTDRAIPDMPRPRSWMNKNGIEKSFPAISLRQTKDRTGISLPDRSLAKPLHGRGFGGGRVSLPHHWGKYPVSPWPISMI